MTPNDFHLETVLYIRRSFEED